MLIAIGPKCPKCESADFENVLLDDFKTSFICCARCGAVIAFRDEFLLCKLDEVINNQDAIIEEMKRIR